MKVTIGDYMRIARENANLRQVDVQSRRGINNRNLSNWEKNVSEPCIEDAIILADLYGITLDELFGHKNTNLNTLVVGELTNVEKRFVLSIRKLNNEGQLKALEYIDDLEGNSKYNEREKDISA